MRKLIIFLIPIAPVLIISCQPTIKLAATYCSEYKSEDFEREDISENGIAIMPITCDPGLEDQLAILQKEISSRMILHFGEEHVVRPEEVSINLHKAGLANEYSAALKQYRVNGTFQKDVILQLGNTFESQYLLILHLTSSLEGRILPESVRRLPKSIKEINVTSLLLTTKQGEVVWKGSGGYSEYLGISNELIALTAAGIASSIGAAENEGPCESLTPLVESVLEAELKNWGCIGLPALIGITFLVIRFYPWY